MKSHNQKSSGAEDNRLEKWLDLNKSAAQNPENLRRPKDQPIPLSFGQLRLWFLQQLNPENPFYHYAEYYRITGPLQKERFFDSFKELVNRHDILRTTFYSKDGTPQQQINDKLEPEINYHDLGSIDTDSKVKQAESQAIEDASRPFDLETGPLVRLTLLHLNDQEYRMVITMHHIITDKWSMNILREQWSQLYRGEILLANDIQYADFAFQQRQSAVEPKHIEYWEEKLAREIPALELPLRRNRKGNPTYTGACCEQKFTSEQSQGLRKLCRDNNTTMFVLMLSVFKVLLYRYTSESDLIVATPVTNRDQTSFESLIGFFNETLLLRSRIHGNMSFQEVVNTIKTSVLEALNHKNVPFESVVQKLKPERLISSNPLFQVMFLYHEVPQTTPLDLEVHWTYKPLDIGVSKFDLTLYISEENQQLSAIFEYASDIFDQFAIELMQGHLNQLVTGIIQTPVMSIASLPLLTKNERRQLLHEWNRPIFPFDGPETITELIESNIQKFPDQPAVVFGDEFVSYKKLDQQANHVVHRIRSNRPNEVGPIGVCAERSSEMIVGILAALKLGRTYVPMDSKYPWSRLKHMIHDAGITQVVTQDHLMYKFEPQLASTVSLNTGSGEHLIESPAIEYVERSSNVYIIFTSGSTGKPKGVPVTHKNLLSSIQARLSCYPNQPGTFLLLSSFSFDSSVAGIFWTLCCGGTLVLPGEKLEQDLEALSTLVYKNQVTHTLMLPSLYHLLLQHGAIEKLKSLNTVVLAGEACQAETCINHFDKLPHTELYNEYGPTEATVWSAVYQVQPHDCTDPIPIGRPIENTQIFILQENCSQVPAGVIGEIHIGGHGVVSGYLNQKEEANTSFVENPFDSELGVHLYRTGDLGRYRPDGMIEFLGRKDQQLKIRGYRVEPDEIHKVINSFPGIRECQVILRQNEATAEPDRLNEENIDMITKVLEVVDPGQAEQILCSIESMKHFDLNTDDGQEN